MDPSDPGSQPFENNDPKTIQSSAVNPPIEPERSKSDVFNAVFYIVIFCLVGVPVWWKTTTVSRVSLPLDAIAGFASFSEPKVHPALAEKGLSVTRPSQKWKTFWVLPPTSAIDIVFTLVNPAPNAMDVRWEIVDGLHRFLDPVLTTLSPIANFTVTSQILRYIDADIATSFDSTSKSHQVSFREASKLINHVESRLGSFSSNNHVLNFVVYVPPPLQSPLKVLSTDERLIPTNSFITPRWGGVYVYSPENLSDSAVINVDVKAVTEVFLAQLYVHIGLFDPDETEGRMTDISKDLEQLIISRTRLNLDDSVSTLQSLVSLLGQMGSIAINEEVGINIHDAVQSIREAQLNLDSGNYVIALEKSRRAWEKSEQAFFDPSLLEQLYFPEDQKFAIYVPLFLPAGLPVLLSLREMIVQRWRKTRL